MSIIAFGVWERNNLVDIFRDEQNAKEYTRLLNFINSIKHEEVNYRVEVLPDCIFGDTVIIDDYIKDIVENNVIIATGTIEKDTIRLKEWELCDKEGENICFYSIEGDFTKNPEADSIKIRFYIPMKKEYLYMTKEDIKEKLNIKLYELYKKAKTDLPEFFNS